MTEPTEAAFRHADELAPYGTYRLALAVHIQQVSDAAKVVAKEISKSPDGNVNYLADERLAPFILPEPVDPLVMAMRGSVPDPKVFASVVRQRLAKDGYKIVKDET